MPTQCSQTELDLGSSGGHKPVRAVDGGTSTSNGGVVLLAAADRAIGLSRRLARYFTDLRLADAVRHSVADLLRQRVFAIALGHEDLSDHNRPPSTAGEAGHRIRADRAPCCPYARAQVRLGTWGLK